MGHHGLPFLLLAFIIAPILGGQSFKLRTTIVLGTEVGTWLWERSLAHQHQIKQANKSSKQ
jgi:hypothetical protein